MCVFVILLALLWHPLRTGADQVWLMVSDLHVDPFERVHTPAPSDYGADTNWVLFDSTMSAMHRAEPNPKAIVIAGDFLAHDFASKVRGHGGVTQVAQATMARIARTFARTFPHAQVLIALGNNDDPCGDYRTAPDTAYLKSVARIWAPLVNRNGAAPQFERQFSHAGFYTARTPVGRLRVIALNAVFWSRKYRPCGDANNVPSDEVRWLRQSLAATPSRLQNIVLMHIPPGVDAYSTLYLWGFIVVPFLGQVPEKKIASALRARHDRISFVLAGHVHQLGMRIVGDAPALIAPSVSPIYNGNPAFLRLRITSAGVLDDYDMYAYDFRSRLWHSIFDFDAAYGVRAFDAKTLRLVHERIAKDEETRTRWLRAMDADSPYPRATSSNWTAYWCAETVTGAAYAGCTGDRRRIQALSIAVIAAVLAIVLALGARTMHRIRRSHA